MNMLRQPSTIFLVARLFRRRLSRTAVRPVFVAMTMANVGLVAGCDPATSSAEPGQRVSMVGKGAKNSEPAGPDNSAAVTSTARTLPHSLAPYVLPFEARANPFAPPTEELNRRTTAAEGTHEADVKLLGLMTDEAASMAVITVDDREFIVNVDTRFESASGATELRIVEIRSTDIVVEQNGRRWVVELPAP